MDSQPEPSPGGPQSRLVRHADRASYDAAVVFSIIDEALLCHIACQIDGVALTLPTAHVRIEDQIYLHGALSNRMLRALVAAQSASATFTLLDGLVLARTAFHHSLNFRSVVVFGPACEVVDVEEKRRALHALVEHIAPGRMRELQPPTAAELGATRVLRLHIAEASAKIRRGPPLDRASDHALPVWAGTVPLHLQAGAPLRDSALPSERLLSSAAAGRADGPAGPPIERSEGEYVFSSDPSRLQIPEILRFLSEEAYWAKGVDAESLRRSLEHSLCVGAYRDGQQIGLARVVTDRARFAYLCDVFVLAPERGRGVGRALMRFVLDHPVLREVERWLLGTRDAHGFYEQVGFRRDELGRFMLRPREPGRE